MANNTNDVSFPEAIRTSIAHFTSDMNVCLPGRIVKVLDYKRRKISVQPEIIREYLDETTLEPPIIENVPLMYYGTTDGLVKFPIKVGDKVILIFSQRSLDRWLSEDMLTLPGSTRKYDITDAIAIPCIMAFKEDHPKITDNENTEIIFNDSKIIIEPGGNIQIDANGGKVVVNNAVEDLALLMSDFLDDIIAIVTVGSPSTHTLNLTSIANFQAIKVRLATLLEQS